jgi:hypothetical protein
MVETMPAETVRSVSRSGAPAKATLQTQVALTFSRCNSASPRSYLQADSEP